MESGRSEAREQAGSAARIQQLEAELAATKATLRQVESSTIWRAVGVLRERVFGRIGEDSRAARATRKLARRAALRIIDRAHEPPAAPIAQIPRHEDPEVSLVLPVHSQPELTAACVRAIAATATVPYELIVVDDTATPAVKDVIARIGGATVLVNERNAGYTRSLNRGAERARAEFLVFMNDDTVPQPGWLEALVDCARSDAEIGVVTPMYLAPDGRLKEAGSLIYSDGSAENFGRGDDCPERSRYRYRRDVDYGSGAALLVRASVFREIGGLDERFSPAYYEDVDLCFAAREAGARVVYEPRARVIHVEGATAGTDVSAGAKRHQELHREPFKEKWRHRLAEQPDRGIDPRLVNNRANGLRVLVADHSVPTPDRDGGSSRMWRLIQAFRGLGCSVTVLPASGEVAEPYASRLEQQGVEVLRRPEDVGHELAALGPELDLALLSRPHVASRYVYLLRELAPGARIAYDVVDVHYLRELRRSLVEERPGDARVAALRELELAMVRCCDVTVVVTDDEREELLRSVPDAEIVVVPTIQEPFAEVPPPGARDGILFVGSFLHPPNVDAARYLVEHVLPRVPDTHLTIVGQAPPEELAGPNVTVAGWVEDLAPLLAKARVAVAPMRYGAGLKVKTVEALAYGLPIVSTTLGAEGLGVSDGVQLLLADEPDDFAAAIERLLTDDELWTELSEAGRAHVRERYAADVVTPRLEALFARQPSR